MDGSFPCPLTLVLQKSKRWVGQWGWGGSKRSRVFQTWIQSLFPVHVLCPFFGFQTPLAWNLSPFLFCNSFPHILSTHNPVQLTRSLLLHCFRGLKILLPFFHAKSVFSTSDNFQMCIYLPLSHWVPVSKTPGPDWGWGGGEGGGGSRDVGNRSHFKWTLMSNHNSLTFSLRNNANV